MSPEQAFEIQQLQLNNQAKQLELELKKAKSRGIALNATVAAAILALLGVIGKGLLDASSALDVQRDKSRTELILKGMAPDNISKSQDYWDFLIKNNIVVANSH